MGDYKLNEREHIYILKLYNSDIYLKKGDYGTRYLFFKRKNKIKDVATQTRWAKCIDPINYKNDYIKDFVKKLIELKILQIELTENNESENSNIEFYKLNRIKLYDFLYENDPYFIITKRMIVEQDPDVPRFILK